MHPYISIDTTFAWQKLHFILSVRSDFHMIDSLSIAVPVIVSRVLMSFSVDETLLPWKVNLSIRFKELPPRVEMSPVFRFVCIDMDLGFFLCNTPLSLYIYIYIYIYTYICFSIPVQVIICLSFSMHSYIHPLYDFLSSVILHTLMTFKTLNLKYWIVEEVNLKLFHLKKKLLHTHTYTHKYIYIYIYMSVCVLCS